MAEPSIQTPTDESGFGELARQVRECQRCRLGASRTKAVFGMGSSVSPLVFVGEGPGAQEDAQGLPFVGRSGKLLDTLIAQELGITRDVLYIANIVKCRPPQNRNPAADEVQACTPYLAAQLAYISPELIVALGAVAAKYFLGDGLSISAARGRFFSTAVGTVMPMFHPSYGLRQGPSAVSAMRADLVAAKLYLHKREKWPWPSV